MNAISFFSVIFSLVTFAVQAQPVSMTTPVNASVTMKGLVCTDYHPRGEWTNCETQEFAMTNVILEGISFDVYHTKPHSFAVSGGTKFPVALIFNYRGADFDFSKENAFFPGHIKFDENSATYDRHVAFSSCPPHSYKSKFFSKDLTVLDEGYWSACGGGARLNKKMVFTEGKKIQLFENLQYGRSGGIPQYALKIVVDKQ